MENYVKYSKIKVDADKWIICEKNHDPFRPSKLSVTSAIDTETLVFIDGKIVSQKELFKMLKDSTTEEKRKRLSNLTWAWLNYDEYNGFFMTNDFETFLLYLSRCGIKFSWCYNSTFDFAQIDYQILAIGKDKWKKHVKRQKNYADLTECKTIQETIDTKIETSIENRRIDHYNKHQPYTYESIHNDSGARYAYKLWFPYRQKQDRHEYVHAIEFRDFMKLVVGGLAKLLKDLDVTDNEGNKIRKLEMEYQAVDPNNLTEKEIDYCVNDVKGLYFAIKKFNKVVETISNRESHIYGKETNIMTSGGFAKAELLRSLYPKMCRFKRLKQFQKEHPLTIEQDAYIRNNHLYRGGITFLNKRYRGKLITDRKLYRYDVNSEYPFAMSNIRDLVGKSRCIKYKTWLKMSKKKKEEYEAIYILESVTGYVYSNMVGIWYDPFRHDFVDVIDEDQPHLIFERELNELSNWYDLEYTCNKVIIVRRGDYVFKKFVTKNYKRKADAKREENGTLEKVTKLLLNSSYGKLAERIERREGHYELNEETEAIHFVEDQTKIDANSIMNVIIGSLITCEGRLTLLRYIREVCKNVANDFVYCDTDSVHCLNCNFEKADPYTLGALKLEAINDACRYLAPKTYIDIEKIEKGDMIDLKNIEIHSKGISLSSIKKDFRSKAKVKRIDNEDHYFLSIDKISDNIDYGVKYVVLCAMNVKGGKVLIPTEKFLARTELAPQQEQQFLSKGVDSHAYYTER